MKKTIMVMCYSHLESDPRVLVQLHALKEDYDLLAVGYSNPGIEGVQFVPVEFPRLGFMSKLYRMGFKLIGLNFVAFWDRTNRDNYSKLSVLVEKADCIIANDADIVPIAFRLRKKFHSKLCIDAHEYYPDHEQSGGLKAELRRRYKQWIVKKFFHTADKVITVSSGIKDIYKSEFSINCDVIMNLPQPSDLTPSRVDENEIKLVHHGLALPARKLELMIDVMNYLSDGYSLTFFLKSSPDKVSQSYLLWLKAYAKRTSRKIYFEDPVPTADIPNVLNKYDIGLYLLVPTTINQKFMLPNKFFEFIQARLAIAIGPSEEMKRIVLETGNGCVSGSFEPAELADLIGALQVNVLEEFKENSNQIASKFNGMVSMKYWQRTIRGMIE